MTRVLCRNPILPCDTLTILTTIQLKIISAFKALDGFLVRQNNKAHTRLETLYQKFDRERTASFKDSLEASWQIALISIMAIEFLFAFFGIFGVLAVTGGFNTANDQMLISTWLFWIVCMVIAIVSGTLCWTIVGAFHVWKNLSFWVITPVYVLVASLMVVESIRLFWPYASTFPQKPFLTDWMIGLFLYAMATVLITYYSITKTNILIYKRSVEHNALMLLLPVEKRDEILSVSAQDHYVLITTKKGEHLHRLALNEAIGMMPVDTGIKIHRSHWVAKKHIRKVVKTGSRYFVALSNGAEIPLSAAKIDDVSAVLP